MPHIFNTIVLSEDNKPHDFALIIKNYVSLKIKKL